jgi:hypothetical protein
MKITIRLLAPLILVIAAGCVLSSPPSRVRMIDVSYPASVSHADVVETAIAVGREIGFPPATKIDKTEGIVEFGPFGMPAIGITAQARVKSDGDLEVTVNTLSRLVAESADEPAQAFKAQFESRLANMAKKDAK